MEPDHDKRDSGNGGALWNLYTLRVSRAPEIQLVKDQNPLVEALLNNELLHIQAFVVHINLVLSHEIAFKLSVDITQCHKPIKPHIPYPVSRPKAGIKARNQGSKSRPETCKNI